MFENYVDFWYAFFRSDIHLFLRFVYNKPYLFSEIV